MATTTYTVKAPLVIAKSETGSDVYVYQGGPVPDGQSSEWIARHLEDDMIVKGEFVPEAPKAPDSDAGAASDEKPAKGAK